MPGTLTLPQTTDRSELYGSLYPQVKALLQGERDPVAAMANMCAALHQAFGPDGLGQGCWHWVGFYRAMGAELVLGPFQGPVACMRIGHGKGVCGTAWAQGRTLIVPDVTQFPGHIACSALTRSEIVVPLVGRDGHVHAVLDIDSLRQDDFNEVDAQALAGLLGLLAPLFD